MATQTVIGSGNEKINGGTILHGGTIASEIWDNLSLSTNSHTFETSTRLIPASVAHMHKPLSAGVYGSMETGKYIIRGYCTRIAQTSNSVLNNGASAFFRMPIKYIESARRLHITAWNAVTGAATKGGSAGASYNFTAIDAGSTIDQAAHPSRAVPGELVYMVKGSNATMVDYSEITGK